MPIPSHNPIIIWSKHLKLPDSGREKLNPQIEEKMKREK